MRKAFDVLVIGAGIVGCSIAYYAAQARLRVLLIERGDIAGEASLVGAGMLAPVSETRALPADLPETHPQRVCQRLYLAGLRCYEDLDERLKAETGMDIGLVRRPMLRIALSDEEETTVRAELAQQKHLLPGLEWLDAATVRASDAIFAAHTELRGALISPHEPNVSAPQLARTYARGATLYGATVLTGCTAEQLIVEHGRVVGVQTDQDIYYAERVVLAAGAWASRWHVPTEAPPIFPLKGQALSLHAQPARPLRHMVFHGGTGAYLVPKADGSIYVGATSERVGFDKIITPAGLAVLLEKLKTIAPALLEARFAGALVGLRPASADEMPLLGETQSRPGLWLAGGHARNGILLAPITGMLLAQAFQERALPFDIDIRPFDPDRFGGWDGVVPQVRR